jgi:hypothetical protein
MKLLADENVRGAIFSSLQANLENGRVRCCTYHCVKPPPSSPSHQARPILGNSEDSRALIMPVTDLAV